MNAPSNALSGPSNKIPDEVRAEQTKDLKFGMFICWSFSSFSGYEWSRSVKDVGFFGATGCDTDQWCQVAKDAGMNYILFLTKYHDGFCLWDTTTTEWKVTNPIASRRPLAKTHLSHLFLRMSFREGQIKPWTYRKFQLTITQRSKNMANRTQETWSGKASHGLT